MDVDHSLFVGVQSRVQSKLVRTTYRALGQLTSLGKGAATTAAASADEFTVLVCVCVVMLRLVCSLLFCVLMICSLSICRQVYTRFSLVQDEESLLARMILAFVKEDRGTSKQQPAAVCRKGSWLYLQVMKRH